MGEETKFDLRQVIPTVLRAEVVRVAESEGREPREVMWALLLLGAEARRAGAALPAGAELDERMVRLDQVRDAGR